MSTSGQADWSLLVGVSLFIAATTGTIIAVAPNVLVDWPAGDHQAVRYFIIDVSISQCVEALVAWLLMGWIFIIGGQLKEDRQHLRLMPYAAFALVMSKPLLLIYQPLAAFLSKESSGNCFPTCDVDDQLCFIYALVCFDGPGIVQFLLFRALPLILILAAFVGPIRLRQSMTEDFQ